MIRRLAVTVLMALAALPAAAQIEYTAPAGGTFTGGTITSPILAPAADNCSAVPYSFGGSTTTGLCAVSANIGALHSGAPVLAFQQGTVFVPSGVGFVFTDGSYGASQSTRLTRGATGTLWQRSVVATSQAQEYHWTNFYTDGSNYQGGVLKTSASGIEIAAETAGSGADNLDVTIRAAGSGAVKLVANGYGWGVDAGTGIPWLPILDDGQPIGSPTFRPMHVYISRSIQGSKTKTLTESSATTFVTVAVPQTAGANYAAGRVGYTVYASDGTDSQTLHGVAQFSAVNKAGTETCAAIADVQTAVAESAGGSTLTCTITCVTGLTDVVGLAANCASSLTQTTLTIQARLDLEQPNTLVFP